MWNATLAQWGEPRGTSSTDSKYTRQKAQSCLRRLWMLQAQPPGPQSPQTSRLWDPSHWGFYTNKAETLGLYTNRPLYTVFWYLLLT